MKQSNLSRVDGFVPQEVGGLELLTRYSMNTTKAIGHIKMQEKEQIDGKQWTRKYLRNQFYRKELEGLYRKYDDKLRESIIYIYITLLVTFSVIHTVLVIVGIIYTEEVQPNSTYLSIAMYVLRIIISILSFWMCFYHPVRKKCIWMPIIMTYVITVVLIISDVAVPIYSKASEGITLRPAYSTLALLSIYIFLPLRNNFLVTILGVVVSVVYVLTYAFFTYYGDPQIGITIASDVIYMIGVNIMGSYFRLMNEIVTRRSFLDKHACVESTLRLKFVKHLEERLMSSILPEHIVSRVRHDIRLIYLRLQSHNLVENIKTFNDKYVEEHDNVSILYADVVNYTKISTTLSPMRMVELLNELFGRFDDASEEHDVLRIKFLGDCYYCVSGIPKPTAYHAKNCVDLGLEMIHIIKDVREKHVLDIDMRIGVHSGRILSGLIGIRKWQFDIWSKDATIANKIESTGQAGKVHITKQTLELLQGFTREYIIEPNFAAQSDLFISKNKLETYLISESTMLIEDKPYRRASVGLNKILTKSATRLLETRGQNAFRRSTPLSEENLVEFQQMRRSADAQMAKDIEDMTNGGIDQFKKEWRLNRITLMFKNFDMEKEFLLQPDPLFKYYITCCLIILLLILLINGLTTNWFSGFQWYTWILFGLLLFILIAMQPLTWFHFLWTTYKGFKEPKNTFLRSVYDLSEHIIKSVRVRTAMYMIISIGLTVTSIVNIFGCSEREIESSSETVVSNCMSSWQVTQCWGLVLLLNFLFSRVFFIVKWIIAGVMTLFYLWMVWEIKVSIFAIDAAWNLEFDSRVSHTMYVVFITVTLYCIDRTTEFRNKLDYLWHVQLDEEQQEAETMLKVNNMLLENILPGHVVQVYLKLNRSIDELYYEKYNNVAVMFASLTDYKLGVEDDADLSDATVLGMLDSVISDFDRLLLTGSSVYKVEKIKMAGWTYMAACGLDPSKRTSVNSNSSNNVVQNLMYNRTIVLTMVEFAAAMMKKLQEFNRGSFQSFEGLNLRIGISNGEVAAGVVGSSKPLYDIWGHAVNMASRMDSTGETGKIQVTENTALILEECGILTMYRGETFVKGAGYIKTFYVPLNEQLDLVRTDQYNTYSNSNLRSQYDVRDNMDDYISSDSENYDTQSQFGNSNLNIRSKLDITCNVTFDDSTKYESNADIHDKNNENNVENNSVINNKRYESNIETTTEVIDIPSPKENITSIQNKVFDCDHNVGITSKDSMIEETKL